MSRLLCPALLLVILGAGCRRPAESDKAAGTVQLEVFSRSLTKDAIVFDYRLTNRLQGALYFICPDPACSGDPPWPKLPFYELNESSVLAAYSYVARKPYTQLCELQAYEPMKLEAGDAYSSRVTLTAPYVTNRPYGGSEYPPETIWGPMIDRLQLTIGYFVCPGIATGPECKATPETELTRYDAHDTSFYLDCGSEDDELVPQHLVSAEAGISHTGDWPDKLVPRSMNERKGSMDAGR